ncbi:MAG: DNA replication and repair protein RecF [Melioribacter sp.]|nr:DNA replication and repair protein RecF [Melioribacter sp.]
MVLKQIELQNFRLHRNTSLNFSDKLNIIIGGNGQGKTTILEAIYYLCTTKNMHSSSEQEVVTFNESSFQVNGIFQEIIIDKVKLHYDSVKNKKTYFLNDKQLSSATEIIGKFPVVKLTQADHEITQGSPAKRRRFVDSIISQVSQTYLKTLLEYSKILKQRALLLSLIKENKDINLFQQLEVWTDALVIRGVEITKHRKEFIKEFESYLKVAFEKIMDSEELPKINYISILKEEENEEKKFRKELETQREEEIRKGANLIGPHRDDYVFYLNERELYKYGSQGQHKTYIVALRFAQFTYIKEKLGRTPIFLMDDIFGELDKYRATKITNYLPEIGQAFITMTDLTKEDEIKGFSESLLIRVKDGKATTIN